MKVSVKNMGPIATGSVELHPLTIMAGPANSGKSFMATIIYAILQGIEEHSRLWCRHLEHAVIEDQLQNIKLETPKTIDAKDKKFRIKSHYVDSMVQEIKEKMAMFIGCRPDALTRRNKNGNKCTSRLCDVQFSTQGNPKWGLNITKSGKDGKACFRDSQSEKYILNKGLIGDALQRDSSPVGYSRLGGYRHKIATRISSEVFFGYDASSIYLPAGRGGLFQAYKFLVHEILRASPRIAIIGTQRDDILGIEKGIVADYLSKISLIGSRSARTPRRIMRNTRPGDMEEIVSRTERILNGSVEVRKGHLAGHAELRYIDAHGNVYPLHVAASTVNELASLLLFLKKGMISSGSTLIFEEPESHLHPSAQRDIAGVIVAMVNHGIKVIITTHSPTILSQISNYTKAAERDETLNGMAISADMVGVYEFVRDEEKFETRIKKIETKCVKAHGITIKGHSEAYSNLFNETSDLYQED